jgi:succinate-semialdehyde dehydrogenase/glutarate-semialdehyde dehydrogenase
MKAINPATGELLKEYQDHSDQEVDHLIDRAEKQFRSWRDVPFTGRGTLMRRAAAVLRDKKEAYARTITLEMGKLIGESRAEVEKCAWVCEYYAEQAAGFLADEVVATDASRSLVAFQPLGIVLAVMPWNFPFWQVFRFAAPALMAGNTALLKHASNVPGCALAIEEVFRLAGFPEGAFTALLISAGQVGRIFRNPQVKAVTLTGSEPAGANVAAAAGAELKKMVLELGGSDAYIVLEDADLDACLATGVSARMFNAGQSCIAAKRFIVVEPLVETFQDELSRRMSALKIGDPLHEDTQVGPLARPDLVEEIHAQVTRSVELGARLLCGGEKPAGPGAYYPPTVLAGVARGMPVCDEETFGPVAAVIPARDMEAAVAIANDSRFGLGGSVWTRDMHKGEAVARRIESGAVFVNGMTKSDPRLPFGGIKKSGYGRELSSFGIREFVNIKTIWIA